MALPDELNAILDRIITGTQTTEDLDTLRRKLILDGQENVKQSGKYNVHIGEGQSVTIGDTLYQGPSAEAIRHAIQEALKTSARSEAAEHWLIRPVPISELELEAFELGDRAAATFPYVIDPVRDVYLQTVQALEDASNVTRRIKRGVLILGESNAGKTRLALEALKQTLPNWSLLRWRPYYTRDDIPPSHLLQGEQLVLFLDDLQEYAETSSKRESAIDQVILPEQSARTLLTLVEDVLLQARQNTVIVATCRNENVEQVQAVLDSLLARLAYIEVPSYKDSLDSLQAKQVIAAFQQQGSIHLEDWDGTMGSLVLGLSKKYDYYVTLPSHAKNVLKAMKLLTIARTTIHTEPRVRAICAEVFTDKVLQENERLWRDTIDLLTNTQFVREDFDKNKQDFIFVIRKDSYFAKVVRDYPPSHRPHQKERDLMQLRKVFRELEDFRGLLNLAFSHLLSRQFEDANMVIDQALALEPNNVEAWSMKSIVLAALGRPEDSLTTINHALEINSTNVELFAALLFNKGATLGMLKRYEEALAAFEQFFVLDSKNIATLHIVAWRNKGKVLGLLKRPEEALAAYEQALALDSKNADSWRGKGMVLAQLKRPEEALAAYEQALALDSKNADSWRGKGKVLGLLKRYEEALAAYEQALALDSKNVAAWRGKGKVLAQLERYKEALAATNRVLALDPNDTNIQNFKALQLGKWQLKQTLTALERTLELDPKNAAAWSNKGVCLFQLGNREESLIALDRAINLDPKNSNAQRNKQYILLRSEQHTEATVLVNQLQDLQQPLTLQQPLNNCLLLSFIFSKIDDKQSKQSNYTYEVGRAHRGKKAKRPKQITRDTRAK